MKSPFRAIIAFILAASLAVSSGCAAPTPSPTPTQEPTTVPTHSGAGPGPHLYRTDAQGTGRTLVLPDAVSDFDIGGSGILYANQDDQNRLYLYSQDSQKSVMLSGRSASSITAWDSWVYYIGGDESGLWRVLDNGDDGSQIASQCGGPFVFTMDGIYYRDRTRKEIRRVQEDGTQDEAIVDLGQAAGEIRSFQVVDGWLYYSVHGDSVDTSALCRIENGSKEPVVLLQDITSLVTVNGGFVYFFDFGSMYGLCRMPVEGGDATLVSDQSTKQPDLDGCFAYAGGRIYLATMTGFVTMNPDGTDVKPLGQASGTMLTIVDDSVYYMYGEELHRIMKDGTDDRMVGWLEITSTTTPYRIIENTVYYIGKTLD